MQKAIVSALFGAASFIGGVAVELLAPKAPSWMAWTLVALALILAALAVTLWLLSSKERQGEAETVQIDDNRRGNFVDGSPSGIVNQTYYDRLPPRLVSADSFAGAADGAQPTAIVRPTEQELERFQFGESLVVALRANGIAADIQSGYSKHTEPFAGVIIRAAPNSNARTVAANVEQAIKREGIAASIGEPMNGWDDNNRILILIGAHA